MWHFRKWAALVAIASLAIPAAVSAQQPRYGGELVFPVPSEPPSYDGHREETFGLIHPIAPFYNTLLRVDPTDPGGTKPYPSLAESWTVSKDGKTYTFKVRTGVKFHDGSVMTSKDVKASYDKIIFPAPGVGSSRKGQYSDVEAVEAPDATTVVFRLKHPSGSFIASLLSPYNFIYKADILAKDPHWYETHIMGTGPFMRINGEAPGVLAEEAKRLGALLVHYSTDYVFDGEKKGAYVETDPPNPLGAYGRSKLAGERAVTASGCRHLIFRTCWVYAPRGRNFLLTILKAARERPELRVVDDQFGAPTSSAAIAEATKHALAKPGEGAYHMSAAGRTNWHGFAQAIVQGAGLATPVKAISSAEYPTPARRPRNSMLDNSKLKKDFGVALPDWRDGLREVLPQALR